MKYHRIAGCLVGILIFTGSRTVSADVKMTAIFGDHMVLQEGASLPLWGTADAGEKVTVWVGSVTGSTTAEADGKWIVKLPPIPAGTTPVTVKVTGKNSLKFEDVLIGDVWVCSGQSNMEFGISNAHNAKEELPHADLPLVRIFLVPKKTAITPQDDIGAAPTQNPLQGHWQVCTPDNLVKVGGWNGFTAVGYFFGREIQKTTGQPVGLIGTYWGGTPAQAWTSLSALQNEPSLKHYADVVDKIQAGYSQAQAAYPAAQAAYAADKAKWDQEVGKAYTASLQAWKDAAAKAVAAGQPAPPRPAPSTPAPKMPADPTGGPNSPTTLFNGMIAPLIPYGIKGAIWYQGESNAGQPVEYRTLFPDMITDWRQRWDEGNFPFLFVQLAKFKNPTENWALLREAQLKTLALPNTGMAVAFDIGDQNDIHPKDKIDVGLRLALGAKHVAYGQTLVYSGPIYDKSDVSGNSIRVSFTQTGGGLVIGTAPWIPPSAKPLPTDTLVGFTIAGADKKWVPADAKIDGNSVVVSSAQVSQPVAVRYAYENAVGNLYNKEGLPASPFRSDDWPPAPVPPAATPSAPAPVTK